ncbi:MAG: Gfo/Idh/MocA family oxidoreductase [Reichenbachiella sp.]|uniref:Gfo/Idh/MocA family protein n=1 Tax=Reichenbachiella sp. TaxID=2184521 RepID=UPI00329994D0
MKRGILICFLMGIMFAHTSFAQKNKPLKVGIIGLTHTHVHWLLGRPKADDIQIVGIVEPNKNLAQRYADQHGYSMDLVYDTMEEMIEATQPEAVTAFGTIYEHLAVVETCAPKGIHVMVEKPLAVSMAHAKKMEALAKKHNIQLLTNYETTWYATNHKAYNMVNQGQVGDLRKIVIHDGHKGPIELGINSEFIDWLTDPVQNGGGAVVDFGCYGANLITWMTNGQKPDQVMAVTQTIKPDVYTKVDDEATIILKYPKMQGIIQASWNWPIARKDMEVYGQTGYIYADNRNDLRYRLSEAQEEQKENLEERKYPYNDPFALLAAVVKGKVTLPPYALSSLENNMIVVEILDAARESAKTGRTIDLNP